MLGSLPRCVFVTQSGPRWRACEYDVLRRGAEKSAIAKLRRFCIVGMVDAGCLTSGIERWERNRSWASEQGQVRHAVIVATVFPGARDNTERGRRSGLANASAFDVELG